VVDIVEQEYLAYLFINNSNVKMHSQLKKDVANDYSKGNTDAYPKDIHKALTLMNKYKPLKLDAQVVPAQRTAFVTGGQGGKGRKGAKYLQDGEWNALSPEAKSKIIEARKKGAKGGKDNDDKSSLSAKSAKTIKSLSKTMRSLEKDNKKLQKSVSALQKCNKDDDTNLSISTVEGSSHFQDALEMLEEHHPRIVLALKHRKFTELDLRNVLLLDNQLTFDLGRSVITMHIQKSYFLSQHEKTSILFCRTNGQIVFYTMSPMTFVFLNAKLVVLCFIIRHELIFVFCFNSRLRFSCRFYDGLCHTILFSVPWSFCI
jgi:hypothetical protein